MRTDLYNFHTAGGNAAFNHATTTPFRGRDSEAVIAARRGEICRSWSNGKCSSQYTTCSYQHRCETRGGLSSVLASVQLGRPTEILRPRFSKLPSTNRVQNRSYNHRLDSKYFIHDVTCSLPQQTLPLTCAPWQYEKPLSHTYLVYNYLKNHC